MHLWGARIEEQGSFSGSQCIWGKTIDAKERNTTPSLLTMHDAQSHNDIQEGCLQAFFLVAEDW